MFGTSRTTIHISTLGILGFTLVACSKPKLPEKPHCPGAVVKLVDANRNVLALKLKTASGYSLRVPVGIFKTYELNKACEATWVEMRFGWDGQRLVYPPTINHTEVDVVSLEFGIFDEAKLARFAKVEAWRYEDAIPLLQYGLTHYPKWWFPRADYVPRPTKTALTAMMQFAVDGTWDRVRKRPIEFECDVAKNLTAEELRRLAIPDDAICRAGWGFTQDSNATIHFDGAVAKDAQKIFKALDGTIHGFKGS